MMVALIAFMPTVGKGAIGSIDYTDEERKVLAERSLGWKCSSEGCGQCMRDALADAS
jgi:ubiquitin-conjugating enzyme E2 J1